MRAGSVREGGGERAIGDETSQIDPKLIDAF
jgi:hypothetical protein